MAIRPSEMDSQSGSYGINHQSSELMYEVLYLTLHCHSQASLSRPISRGLVLGLQMGSKISRKILRALGLSIVVGLIEALIVASTLGTIVTMIHPERLPPQFATQFIPLMRLNAQTLFIFIFIFIIGWIGAFIGFLAIIGLLLTLGFD